MPAHHTIHNIITAHGVIMVVSLVFLASISVAIAHSMRDTWGPRLWFQIHRGLNVAILAFVAAGVALGIYLWTVFGNGHVHKLLLAHMIIGLIAFGLLLIQASAALILRPHPQSKYRLLWSWIHHSNGYFILLVALANAFIGLFLGDLRWGWYLGTSLIWLLIVVTGAAKSVSNRRKLQYPAGTWPRQQKGVPLANTL